MSRLNIQLLIIDPQYDFMDNKDSALPVPGANKDMDNVARLIKRIGKKLDDIHVTLDSHRRIDIAHPIWWVDQNGNPPGPFTLIFAKDIEAGIWTTRNPGFRARSLAYAKQLEATGKYILCTWPEHCLIGTKGHNVQENLNDALQEWSLKEFAMVDYVTKGSNPWTEHYGALMAEVPDPDDPGTALNTDFIGTMQKADIVGIGGEALSHCEMTTVNQIVDNIGPDHVKKFCIFDDCSSPVPQPPGGPDFPAIAAAWLNDMRGRGVTVMSSEKFLA